MECHCICNFLKAKQEKMCLNEVVGKVIVSVQKDTLESPPSVCFRQHNQIRSVEGRQLRAYLALEVLDLSWNNLTEVHSACFLQGPPLKEL